MLDSVPGARYKDPLRPIAKSSRFSGDLRVASFFSVALGKSQYELFASLDPGANGYLDGDSGHLVQGAVMGSHGCILPWELRWFMECNDQSRPVARDSVLSAIEHHPVDGY